MEQFFILYVFSALAILIIFLLMSSNIAQIKREVRKISSHVVRSYSHAYNDGEIREEQGEKSEALKFYREADYLIRKEMKRATHPEKFGAHRKQIVDKIHALGGTLTAAD